MNKYEKHRKHKKHRITAKGFSKSVYPYGSRLTRRQKGEEKEALETIYNSIMQELSSSKKSNLNTTIRKIQTKFREKMRERKNKSKSKREKKYKSSDYYKTLEELPPQLLDKILTKITDKYEIRDDDVKNMVLVSILYSNTKKQINEILNIIKEFHNDILKCLINRLDYLGQIHAIERGDSSADEEENEMIQDEFYEEKMKLREKMEQQGGILVKLLNNRDEIMRELAKIMKIIDSTNSDYKYIENFVKEFATDWLLELDKIEFNSLSHQTRIKMEDDKRDLSAKMKMIEEKMLGLLREKMFYSEGASASILGIIKDSHDKITEVYNKYKAKLVSEKKSRASSSRRRGTR